MSSLLNCVSIDTVLVVDDEVVRRFHGSLKTVVCLLNPDSQTTEHLLSWINSTNLKIEVEAVYVRNPLVDDSTR